MVAAPLELYPRDHPKLEAVDTVVGREEQLPGSDREVLEIGERDAVAGSRADVLDRGDPRAGGAGHQAGERVVGGHDASGRVGRRHSSNFLGRRVRRPGLIQAEPGTMVPGWTGMPCVGAWSPL